jgi:hypothetical protein
VIQPILVRPVKSADPGAPVRNRGRWALLEGRQTRHLDRHPGRGARALLGLGDDAERVRLARGVAERNLSVRAIEALVRKTLGGKGRALATPPELSVVRKS